MPQHERRLIANCEIEYAAFRSDQGLPRGKRAVAECPECEIAICEEYRMEYAGICTASKASKGK